MKRILLAVACLALSATGARAQKFNDLARTPPMGWNSWNRFQCNVSEQLIRETADAIVSSGMKAAGYTYVNIDDCWHGQRDSLGVIHPDAQRFPSGMKALADYVHSKGLKLGIYSDAGWQTCGGRPGSRGHEYQDAVTYAGWGIDYLKYDWCNTDNLNAHGAYETMARALMSAGRPIVFSLCEWGNNKAWEWATNLGHLWRTTGDIGPCFDCLYDHLEAVGRHVHPRHADPAAAVRRAGALERPGHARGRQRHERERGPRPLLHVGDAGGPAHRRQRRRAHARTRA